jgi:hypothetical protein
VERSVEARVLQLDDDDDSFYNASIESEPLLDRTCAPLWPPLLPLTSSLAVPIASS